MKCQRISGNGMAIGLCDDGCDDEDNGDDPLIRELDLEHLASQVPPDLESSQPSLEQDLTASDPDTPTPEVDTQEGERYLTKEPRFILNSYSIKLNVIGW